MTNDLLIRGLEGLNIVDIGTGTFYRVLGFILRVYFDLIIPGGCLKVIDTMPFSVVADRYTLSWMLLKQRNIYSAHASGRRRNERPRPL